MSRRDIDKSKTNEIASKHLGASGSYSVETNHYDPELLVAIPRSEARSDWGIKGTEFVGYDVWHCHESTFLLNNGFPIAGTLKVVIPSYSESIVESKSFKLFLNSFDMCKMGGSVGIAITHYEAVVREQLSKLLNCNVGVGFHYTNSNSSKDYYDGVNPFMSYEVIEEQFDVSKLSSFDDYTAKGDYPIVVYGIEVEEMASYKRQTNVLRSRCRHTKQKDTGTFFTHLQGKFLLSEADLLRKVVSLRMLDEFHEFCCEKLIFDFLKNKEVEECMVALLYARRGSLDINPIRATSFDIIPQEYVNPRIYSRKTWGQ